MTQPELDRVNGHSRAISAGHEVNALEPYKIEGLFGDEELSKIVRFASSLCDCPIALVSLVEERHQRFVAKVGLNAEHTPRSMSFCAHAMVGEGIMEVCDASVDVRFYDNPLVTGEPNIRFYAGAPLVSAKGDPLGSLCVISSECRSGLSELQRDGLLVLAQAVMRRLESRREHFTHQAWEHAAEANLAASEERFRILADTMPQMVWSTRADGYHDYYNARWYEFTGTDAGETDGTGWNGQFHPEDQARAWETWNHSLTTGEPYEIEYRLKRFDGEYRWTIGRALPMRNDRGEIVRWFGTCTDFHDQRLLHEQKELLSRELVHRIKNIFSVIASLLRLASKGQAELTEFTIKLSDQIAALARAYDYVQPQDGASAFTLKGLLRELFAAYNSHGEERILIHGDDMMLPDTYMTPLALTFHEMATNAMKYGALSTINGAVNLKISKGDSQLVLSWEESGGEPVISGQRQGFGSELIRVSIERQLRGKFVSDLERDGLKATATIPFSE